MSPDEVRRLDDRLALLFIRGELPVMDLKYDVKKHPNAPQIVQGGAAPYQHGAVDQAAATVSIQSARRKPEPTSAPPELESGGAEASQYELLSEEDIAARYNTTEEETVL